MLAFHQAAYDPHQVYKDPEAPWGKYMQFCFIEEVVQWWSMEKNIFMHRIPNVKIVKTLSLVVLHYTFTIY